MNIRYFVAGLCFFSAVPHAAQTSNPLTVQIVNDSGRFLDSQVYVLLTGSDITNVAPPAMRGASVNLNAIPAPTATVCGIPLTGLTPAGSLPSKLTGKTNNVYSFTVDKISSARLWISYGSSSARPCPAPATGKTDNGNGIIQFTGTSGPKNTANYRYDKMEFTYNPSGADSGGSGQGNLTSVDFAGIPMSMEAVGNSNGIDVVVDSRSFYISAATLANTVSRLFPDDREGHSAFEYPEPNANPNNYNVNEPIRWYAPSTLATEKGTPAPYPSFRNYLESLKTITNLESNGTQSFAAATPKYTNSANTVVTMQPIPAYTANYNYKVRIEQDGSGGYRLKLTGTVTGVPSPLPTSTEITMNVSAAKLDTTLYASPLDPGTFGAANAPLAYPADTTTDAARASYFNAVMGNSIYSWIVANVVSAMNYGLFNGGKPGEEANDTQNWFTITKPLPVTQLFGAWRNSNDGFYNPYAALIANSSDSYGFPFSDRGLVGTNPLMSFYDPAPPKNQTVPYLLRITALPDHQLDAPQVTVGTPTSTTIPITWNKPDSAPSGSTVTYNITTYPPLPNPISGLTATSKELTGLTRGMPYTISVTAQAMSADGTTMNSLALPVQSATAGAAGPGTFSPPPATDPSYQIGISRLDSWKVPDSYKVIMAGSLSNKVDPVFFNATNGINYIPLVITDGEGKVAYQNVYQVELGPRNGGYQLLSRPLLGTASLPGVNIDLTPPGPYPVNSGGPLGNMVVGTPGQPVVLKQAVPVVSVDCMFNWAEDNSDNFFSPKRTTTGFATYQGKPVIGRYYGQDYSTLQGNGIAIAADDNHAYALISGTPVDGGLSNFWFNASRCGSSPLTPEF